MKKKKKNYFVIKQEKLYLWLLEFQQWHWQRVCQHRHCRCMSPHPQAAHCRASECHLLPPAPDAHQVSLAHRSCTGIEEKQKYIVINQLVNTKLFITNEFYVSSNLDQAMLTFSPDATHGSRTTLPWDTSMLLGAVVILRSPGGREQKHSCHSHCTDCTDIKVSLKSQTRDSELDL